MNEGMLINPLGPADWNGARARIKTLHNFLASSLLLVFANSFFPTYRNQNLVF